MLQFNLLRPAVNDKRIDKSNPDFHSAKMKRVRQETYETFWDLLLPLNFFSLKSNNLFSIFISSGLRQKICFCKEFPQLSETAKHFSTLTSQLSLNPLISIFHKLFKISADLFNIVAIKKTAFQRFLLDPYRLINLKKHFLSCSVKF